MTELVRPVAYPWRRYVRFSVRGLMVLTLLIGVWMGWIVRSARIQREAVAAILAAGGSVSYESKVRGGVVLPATKSWTRRWLMDFLGIDYFDHVTAVAFDSYATAPDAAMVHVGRLGQLTFLALDESAVSRTGLAQLKGLTSLSELNLSNTQVTDADLVHLTGLTALEELWLEHTQVSDAGLVHLKGLTGLKYLRLSHTKITGTGLLHLKGLVNLQVLDVSGSPVTDAGLEHLKGLTELGELDLSGTKVTGAGFEFLKQELSSTSVVH
jgi:Leucine-rich repeat (LRR) protein